MTEKEKSVPKTILIVEDDSDLLFALSLFLEGNGYAVYGAENGSVALEQLKKHGLPNLILLDMVMPVMDGWEFARKFKAHYQSEAPIIVVKKARYLPEITSFLMAETA